MTSLRNVETGRSSIFGEELYESSTYRTLGLLNGLLIGLALALGTWGVAAYTQAALPTKTPILVFILAGALVMLLAGTTGWLTARFGKSWLTVLLWLLATGVMVLVIGYETSHLRTLLIWLMDRRFWGLQVYPLPVGSLLPITIAGFFILLVLTTLAFAQDYRLEATHSRLTENKTLTMRALLFLCVPLPLVVLAGFITNNMLGGSNAPFAIQLVHEVFQTGRTYEGDLFQLSLEQGINYDAIRGVRDMMTENYTLGIAGFDAQSSTVIVTADFDNGAWVDCRVVNEQVGFCFDASVPYTIGFSSLITGEPLPDICAGCIIRVSDTWRSWLMARKENLQSDPQIQKIVQIGTYTLMRAESPDGSYALECWFQRSNVIELDNCSEVN